jgi:hypothetical protein
LVLFLKIKPIFKNPIAEINKKTADQKYYFYLTQVIYHIKFCPLWSLKLNSVHKPAAPVTGNPFPLPSTDTQREREREREREIEGERKEKRLQTCNVRGEQEERSLDSGAEILR